MITRRAALFSALALASCERARASDSSLPALNTLVRFPLGVAAMTGEFADSAWTALTVTNFGRVTPEWEMKMESLVAPDGAFDWTRADKFVALARDHGMDIHGHALVWYAQAPDAFARIANDRAKFALAYRTYVIGVVARYCGEVKGWDVINEPIADDGSLRDCLWRRVLGDDYIRLAFEHAHEVDRAAPLFLNDYDLETRPAKRAAFLKLAESLLESGVPVGGLGSQTHVDADLEPGRIRAAVADLASLGLKVHVSEFDVSLNRASGLDRAGLEKKQAALAAEVSDAMAGLPEAQRYGVTIWAARDKDSWLRRPPENKGLIPDAPVLFDDDGRAKAMARAFARM